MILVILLLRNFLLNFSERFYKSLAFKFQGQWLSPMQGLGLQYHCKGLQLHGQGQVVVLSLTLVLLVYFYIHIVLMGGGVNYPEGFLKF